MHFIIIWKSVGPSWSGLICAWATNWQWSHTRNSQAAIDQRSLLGCTAYSVIGLVHITSGLKWQEWSGVLWRPILGEVGWSWAACGRPSTWTIRWLTADIDRYHVFSLISLLTSRNLHWTLPSTDQSRPIQVTTAACGTCRVKRRKHNLISYLGNDCADRASSHDIAWLVMLSTFFFLWDIKIPENWAGSVGFN